MAPLPVTMDDVRAAQLRIAGRVHRTPLFRSATLGRMTDTDLWLKAENLQKTGAFKARGALNAIRLLDPKQRSRGLVTMSTGNHGQGLAWAAAQERVRCVVFMPEHAVPTKVEAIRGYGAETRFAPSMERLFETMEAFRLEHGMHFVHPFADVAVIAGQATVALEILEELPEVDAVLVGAGGGGILAGTALVVKSLHPQARVVGVEPAGAAAISRSIAAGEAVVLEQVETVADGLAAPFAAQLNQSIIEPLVDDVVVLTDDQIVRAMGLILERTKLLVEPAGAAGVAALLEGVAGVPPGARVVAVLTGGNVDRKNLARLLAT